MTANKHVDIITAKANNMELVVFFSDGAKWRELPDDYFPVFDTKKEYFLCLPQHEETCLHWLNGGEIQILCQFKHRKDWVSFCGKLKEIKWSDIDCWMQEDTQIRIKRIKPKKEKRWILVNEIDCFQPRMFDNEGNADHALQGSHPNWSKHEIEVEV